MNIVHCSDENNVAVKHTTHIHISLPNNFYTKRTILYSRQAIFYDECCFRFTTGSLRYTSVICNVWSFMLEYELEVVYIEDKREQHNTFW